MGSEPELVELHFELEVDYQHAFQEDRVITMSVAEVIGLQPNEVAFDGVEEFEKNGSFFGLLRGHIPTTKHQIEYLVKHFYHSLQSGNLTEKIVQYSDIQSPPTLDIRELYETDQNDEIDEEHEVDEVTPFEILQQQQQQQHSQSQSQNSNNEIGSMFDGLKQLLQAGFQEIDHEFDKLLNECQAQINEEF